MNLKNKEKRTHLGIDKYLKKKQDVGEKKLAN